MHQLERLSEMDRKRLQAKLYGNIKKGRFFLFTGIALPTMFIVSQWLVKSFLFDPVFMGDIQLNQFFIDLIMFVTRYETYFFIFAVLYAVITLYRGYLVIKTSREQLLLIDIVQKKNIADLTGKDFDLLTELEKNHLAKYLIKEKQKENQLEEEHFEKEWKNLDGRSEPYLFSGVSLDFIFTVISGCVVGSMALEALYRSMDEALGTWLLFYGLIVVMIVALILLIFHTYFAIKGSPVPIEEDKTPRYPPARLRLFSTFGSILYLTIDGLIIFTGVKLFMRDALDPVSAIQLTFAIIAFVIGVVAMILLVRGHIAYKALQGEKKEG